MELIILSLSGSLVAVFLQLSEFFRFRVALQQFRAARAGGRDARRRAQLIESHQHRESIRMNRQDRHLRTLAKAIRFGLTSAALACASMVVWASEPTYNPGHLSPARISQVDEMCRTVMGLRPSDGLTVNLWPGNPDHGSSTNEYRGCVASLSRSVEDITATRAASRADQHCRAKGLEPGSSEFAVCALHDVEAGPVSERIQLASLEVRPFIAPARVNVPASVPGSVSRKRLACAGIGLEPNTGAFASCVEGLTAVMSATFMEEGYRN